MPPLTYKDAGVDQEGKDRVIDKILRMMRRTHDPSVLDNPWGFAGLYAFGGKRIFEKQFRSPVLVACTDGVGTKIKIACAMNKHDTIGIDLVAMSVNDLVVTGAVPMFFLDYIATGRANETMLLQIMTGMVEGCRQSECALLGGETAEMPDHYPSGEYDLAGFAVGVVERSKMLDGKTIRPGDEVIGIGSSGVHSNGYSLVRKILAQSREMELSRRYNDLGRTLGEELLTPTRIYVRTMKDLLRKYKVKKAIKAVANITGGGLIENIPRVIPKNCSVEIRLGSWTPPPVFAMLQKAGEVTRSEMYRVFNMGIGMTLIVDPFFSNAILRRLKKLGEKAWVIGQVVKGHGEVQLVEGVGGTDAS